MIEEDSFHQFSQRQDVVAGPNKTYSSIIPKTHNTVFFKGSLCYVHYLHYVHLDCKDINQSDQFETFAASVGRSHVRMCPRARLASTQKYSVFKSYIPVLQLVIIDSSVNSSQHRGSTSMALDQILISGFVGQQLKSKTSTDQYRWQHCSCRSWLHWMFDCMLAIVSRRKA